MHKVVIHTDIVLDYLTCDDEASSLLRLAHNNFFCYTTVFNAIELFSLAETQKEKQAIEDSLASMRVLGMNAKNAMKYGELFSEYDHLRRFNALIVGLCLESKLPILTTRTDEFKKVKQLHIIPAGYLRKYKTAEEIFKATKK
ncbi:MAG: PIN domain-containing protein [Bacteroidota bacterium]